VRQIERIVKKKERVWNRERERKRERASAISCEDQIILLTCDYAAAPKNNVRKNGIIEASSNAKKLAALGLDPGMQ